MGRSTGFTDIARAGLRFINRQKGSGTRLVTDQFLADEHVQPREIAGYEVEEYTHLGVATRIASGAADVGVGIEAAARQLGLAFVPLVPEDYFLLVAEASLDYAPMRTLIEVLRDPAFRRRVAQLAGYDTAAAGEIVRLEDGLPWQATNAETFSKFENPGFPRVSSRSGQRLLQRVQNRAANVEASPLPPGHLRENAVFLEHRRSPPLPSGCVLPSSLAARPIVMYGLVNRSSSSASAFGLSRSCARYCSRRRCSSRAC